MKTSFANRKVLILNKGWQPVSVSTLKNAVCLLFSEYDDGTPKARVIDPNDYQQYTWSDWSKMRPKAGEDNIATSGGVVLKIPEVVILTRYDKVYFNSVRFNRRGIYLRDKLTCQYCGKKRPPSELNIDHVNPRSRGGQTTWTNCVLSCIECNSRKRDKTPQEAHMRLIKEPQKPKYNLFDGHKPIKSWEAFVSEVFWEVELQNDENRD